MSSAYAHTPFDLHELTSLLGLAFALLHALILLGDQYIHYHPLQLALPFASVAYRPVAVGYGQLAYSGLLIATGSFYERADQPASLALHWFSFLAFLFSLIHAISAGTDSGLLPVAGFFGWQAAVFCFCSPTAWRWFYSPRLDHP